MAGHGISVFLEGGGKSHGAPDSEEKGEAASDEADVAAFEEDRDAFLKGKGAEALAAWKRLKTEY